MTTGFVRRTANPDNYYDRLGAATIRALRLQYPSVSVFAAAVAAELGWEHLSRQAVYDWETTRTRVPLSVLLAACSLKNRRVDEAITRGIQFLSPARPPVAGKGPNDANPALGHFLEGAP